ncbi:MAG TPA: hypothetical protein VGS21_02965 [Acidimicrobiales bacterium]|nr:hypothetical protein [Acidimicrobiales bacterium]
MRIKRSLATATLGVGLLVCALGPVADATGPSGTILSGYGSSVPSSGQAITPGFTISGSVAGLWPGVALWLHLTVTNPQTVAITVTSLTTTVGNASLFCKASNVKVSAYTGSFVVQPGKKVTVAVFAHMFHSTPNQCQGKTFPFTYTGLATAP